MLDTRNWNILPAALLLASACQSSPGIPVDGSESGTAGESTTTSDSQTGDGDGDGDGDGTTTGDGDGDAGPTTSPPSTTNPSTTSYSEEYEYPECGFGDAMCGLGETCVGQECEPLDSLPECNAGLTFVELQIPEAAQGEVLDLSFADLDDDGDDELLVLHPGELVVVRGADESSTIAVDPEADELTAVQVDDDGNLDVFLTSTLDDHAAVLLGVGDGTLLDPTPRNLLGLHQTRAVDWTEGVGQELVGIDEDGLAVRVSELELDAPISAIFEGLFLIPDEQATDLLPADFGPGQQLLVLFRDNNDTGFAMLDNESDEDLAWRYYSFGPHDTFSAVVTGNFDPRFAVVFQYSGDADLYIYEPGPDFAPEYDDGYIAHRISSPTMYDLVHVDGLGLVMSTQLGTRVVRFDGASASCIILEPAGLPTSTRLEVGRFADNPGRELALIGGEGELRLFGRAP